MNCAPDAAASALVAEAGPLEVAMGSGFACARGDAGAVRCWGSDPTVLGAAYGAPSAFSPERQPTLDFDTSQRVVQVSAGWHHACVVFENQRARCWGGNEFGQLGLGTTEDYGDQANETLRALPNLPLRDVLRISAGVRGTCAIVGSASSGSGRVHCWGSDVGGALGDEQSGDFADDEPLDGTRPAALPADAVDVAVGADLACALLVNGAVHCWGDNWARTMGIGDSQCDIGNDEPCIGELGRVPDIPVSGLGGRSVVRLAVNSTAACVVDNGGDLLCWGRDSQSRIGYPDLIAGEFIGAPPGAVDLGADVTIKEVAMGVRHTCTLDAKGAIRCFGEKGPALGYGMTSEVGKAGIGGTQTPAEAYALRADHGVVDLGDFDAEEGPDRAVGVFAGSGASCALMRNGDLRCWGENTQGELGYGAPTLIGAIGDDDTPADEYGTLGTTGVPLGKSL